MSGSRLFPASRSIIGMIHVGALPGTPRHFEPIERIVARAADEARIYEQCGLDAVLIENMHDLPYLCGGVGPEIVAAMTVVGLAVRQVCRLPLGVQILAAANREALSVARAAGGRFVRVENFCYAHVADEGLMPTAEAGPLLRFRRQIGADSVAILADVKKKHAAHALTADISLAEACRTAELCGADGVIITGDATGRPAAARDVADARGAVGCAVCVGSGVTVDNVADYWPNADALLVGSHFKRDGDWRNEVDPARVTAFMDAVRELRKS